MPDHRKESAFIEVGEILPGDKVEGTGFLTNTVEKLTKERLPGDAHAFIVVHYLGGRKDRFPIGEWLKVTRKREAPMDTYQIAGQDREVNAIGAFEPFLIELEAESVSQADLLARQTRQAEGREHILICAIVHKTNVLDAVGKVGDAYWRERFAPGGTIEVDGKVTHSEKAGEIFRQMDAITDAGMYGVHETLVRIGVPEALVKLTASYEDLTLQATKINWRSHARGDGYDLDAAFTKIAADVALIDVEQWCTGSRWVWTDDKRIMVTYCEGDISGEFYFTDESFKAGLAAAAEFYKTH